MGPNELKRQYRRAAANTLDDLGRIVRESAEKYTSIGNFTVSTRILIKINLTFTSCPEYFGRADIH